MANFVERQEDDEETKVVEIGRRREREKDNWMERDCDGDKLQNYRQRLFAIDLHRVYALQLPLREVSWLLLFFHAINDRLERPLSMAL